jgi:hypothetical protein
VRDPSIHDDIIEDDPAGEEIAPKKAQLAKQSTMLQSQNTMNNKEK